MSTAAALVAPANAATSARPLKVVQIGDSYSAGNGAGNYYGPKDCYRSTTSYARQYMQTLSASHNITFVNRACSGGVLADLDNRRFMDEKDVSVYVPERVDQDDPGALRLAEDSGRCSSPYRDDESYELNPYAAVEQASGTRVYFKCKRYMDAQWNGVDRSTDLVILTVGGNDLRFADIVKECFVIGVRDPHDCKDRVDAANRDMPALASRLETFLRKLKVRMRSDSKVLLLSYPFLERDEGLTLGREILGVGTRYEVGREVRELGRKGDDAQRKAIDAVDGESGARVIYIDALKELFAGHEPDGRVCCHNDSRWLHEPTDSPIRYEWYHFNHAGHTEIGKLLSGYGDFAAGHAAEGAAGIDVVFAIDTTGSMGGSINSVKATATELINDISAQTTSARFGLIDYRDFAERTGDAGDYPAKLQADFTADSNAITTAIEGLSLGYGGDGPETMFSALHMAYGLTWRPGVKKLVVVLADAPPLSPEPISGLTADEITRESLAIDPVEVHLVNVGNADSGDITGITQQTNGGVYASSASGAADQIADAVNRSIAQPYAWAAGPYVGKIGDNVTLDGTGSYGVASDIVKWEWDVDDDGTTDITSGTPIATHSFTSELDGLISLRVTDADGRTGLATSVARFSSDGDEIPRDRDNCPDVANHGQEDEDGDGDGDSCDATPGFPTADKEGITESTSSVPIPGPPTPASPASGQSSPTRPTPTKPKSRAKADVVLGKVRLASNRRQLTVQIRCKAVKGTCRGRMSITVGKMSLRRVAYTVKAGKTATVKVPLSRKLRSQMTRRSQRVKVTLTTQAGARTSRSVMFARRKLR